MKKFLSSLQELGQKATQIKQVVQSAPATAAQLRESILLTAGQLQQARNEVQATFTGLRADTEPRLTQALQELNDSADVLPEAGYALAGVDMEVSPVQRLVVHLRKIGDTSESSLRALLSANAHRPTIHALLSSLAKADTLAGEVALSNLEYQELVVHIGPTPSVRLCWKPEGTAEPSAAATHTSTPAHTITHPTTSTPAAAAPPPLPAYGQSSFFEPRPATTTSARPSASSVPAPALVALAEPTPSAAPVVTPAPEPVASTARPSPIRISAPAAEPAAIAGTSAGGGGDWKATALDRFKKMPGVSKYRKA